MQLAADQLEGRVLAELHRAAPIKTGALRDSITSRGRVEATRVVIEVGSPLVQAATTDSGARPHVIVPRRARALRFTVGGRTVFARRADHPGNRPTRWFSRATSRWPELVREVLGRA
jgi:hypothetical protein